MSSHREALLYALLALAITVVLLILLTACETPLRSETSFALMLRS